MVPDVNIWRAAHRLITLHGEDAEFVATRQAEELRACGDPSASDWLRIKRAVAELQAQPSDAIH